MNVPRKLVGRIVEITWMDPNSARGEIETMKHGREALATWREYGIVHEVVDGVVVIAHSYAAAPGESVDLNPDEIQRTTVPEVLIERIKVFMEEPRADQV